MQAIKKQKENATYKFKKQRKCEICCRKPTIIMIAAQARDFFVKLQTFDENLHLT